jgi:hypothetical protein
MRGGWFVVDALIGYVLRWVRGDFEGSAPLAKGAISVARLAGKCPCTTKYEAPGDWRPAEASRQSLGIGKDDR